MRQAPGLNPLWGPFPNEPFSNFDRDKRFYSSVISKIVLRLRTHVVIIILSDANKPSKVLNKVSLTNGSRSSIKTIRNQCRKNHYRADLEDAAVRRASAILRSQRPTAGVQKNRSRRKRN